MRTTSLLLLLALAVPAPLTAAPPGAGASSQGTQDLAALKAAAAKGDAQAQLDYAKALKPPESRIWAQKAADQGLAEAWFWLGYTMNGDATPFYEKAAEKGYAEAFSYLLENLLFRAGPKADVAKAKKFADLARTLNVNLGSDAGEELWTIDRCSEAGAPDIPAADAPTKEESAAVGGEDCEPLRVGRTPDLKKYRACLLSETPPDNNLVAELYANGWGVKRNPRLAIALVCHAGEVPAELMGMVKSLHETRTQAALTEDFLFCDYVTSGMNQGVCADRAEKLAAATRDAALASLVATWPEAHKAAFQRLSAVAETFFKTRATNEVDMTGTARVMLAISEEADLRDAMLAAVRDFEAGKLPAGAEFKTADVALNAVYGQIMKKPELDLGTITKDSIRQTQLKWLAYRDAWAAFGVVRYPKVSADAWKAWATTRRVAQLKELLQQEE